MSIIHEALKRKHEPPVAQTPDQRAVFPAPRAGFDRSQLIPAILGGGGVLVAALMTYVITRPNDVTVIVPPQERQVVVASELERIPGPGEEISMEGLDLPAIAEPAPFVPSLSAARSVEPEPPFGIPVFAPVAPGRANQAVPRVGLAGKADPVLTEPSISSPSITSSAGPSVIAPMEDPVPANAVTIEMSEAKLQSMTGTVIVDGASARPGNSLRVGSEIRASTGEASVEFSRADVNLSTGANAKISRLERRIGRSGTTEEDVTLHLNNGEARAVVRPGGGSVLVSTDLLTAATQSGAFSIKANNDGSVSVVNEGGSVTLIPSERQNAPITLSPNQRATYKNGVFTTR